MYLGSWKIDDLLTFAVNTHNASTGAQTDADSAPSYRVYEDETGTPILTGTMALLDDTNTTGFYSEQITLSTANGFEKGKTYNIRIAATVAGITGSAVRTFQVEAEVDANRLNWGNVDNPTTSNTLSGTTVGVVTQTESISSGGISRASFLSETGIQTIRSNTCQAGSTSTTIVLDAGASAVNNIYKWAWVHITGGTGVGQAPRLITQYTGATKTATIDNTWATTPDNTTTFAILPLSGSGYGAWMVDVSSGFFNGTAGYYQIEIATIYTATTSTIPAQISSDTNDIDIAIASLTDVTAADVWGYASRTLTALDEDTTTVDLDATIRGAVGMTSANLDTQLSALSTDVGAVPTLAEILAGGDIDGYTLEETLKLCLAALAGKLSGANTTTVTIRAADDSKARITATVDSNGNRTAITLDATG